MLERFWLLCLCFVLVACGGDGATDDALVVSENSEVGQSLLGDEATLVPPVVVESTPVRETAVPTPTIVAPTSEPVEAAVDVETDEEADAALPTSLAVGDVVVVPLAADDLSAFSFTRNWYEPILFFVEAAEGLDVSLQIYGEAVAGEPLREANFSEDGRPEIMVFSPPENGDYQVAAQAAAGAGEARLYAFASGMAGVALSQQDPMAAGSVNVYEVVSKNGRPVIAYVNPQAQTFSDLRIQIATADGDIVADANFGGTGSAEAAFVLPLETTAYTITISEVNGMEALYDVVIVTLE